MFTIMFADMAPPQTVELFVREVMRGLLVGGARASYRAVDPPILLVEC
jgi:hypothetical protein